MHITFSTRIPQLASPLLSELGNVQGIWWPLVVHLVPPPLPPALPCPLPPALPMPSSGRQGWIGLRVAERLDFTGSRLEIGGVAFPRCHLSATLPGVRGGAPVRG